MIFRLLDGWMVGWLDCWIVGWLDGWMVGWLVPKSRELDCWMVVDIFDARRFDA